MSIKLWIIINVLLQIITRQHSQTETLDAIPAQTHNCHTTHTFSSLFINTDYNEKRLLRGRVQLKRDGTQWCTGGEWRGNWRMEWVASTLHTTSEHGASSITAADVHTTAASSQLNWRPRSFKWTHPFRWKTKSGFCVCAITFQLASTHYWYVLYSVIQLFTLHFKHTVQDRQ